MPDLLAIGLGGGSIVKLENGGVRVGPQSVGYRIHSESQIFGGKTLTATDAAVVAGMSELGDAKKVSGLDAGNAAAVIGKIRSMVEEVIDKMKITSGDVPVVVVGGGSILVPESLTGANTVMKPDHFEVANAIGAAIA